MLFLVGKARVGEKYNIVGSVETDNLELVQMIGSIIGKDPIYEMVDFHSSRPGHDLRYALCGEKMKDLGWEPPLSLKQRLSEVVDWSLENKRWLSDE